MKKLFIFLAFSVISTAAFADTYQTGGCTGPGCRASQGYGNQEPVRQVQNNPNQAYSTSYNNQDSYYTREENMATSANAQMQKDYASTEQDRRLNDRIRTALGNWSSLRDTLVIKTTNGIVIISGTVDNPEDIAKVSSKVKEVDGVKGLDNRVTVQPK